MRSDADLLAAARTDAGAFRALYDRYAERVYGYHLRRCGHPDAAHDLTAETFAQAWIGQARFEDRAGGSAGPWLFGIARNVLLSSVRKGRLERRACERLAVMQELDRQPAAVAPEEAWLDGLDEMLAGLPVGQREAVRMRVVEDLPYTRVAAALGTTPLGARTRVSRGLAALRGRLTDDLEGHR